MPAKPRLASPCFALPRLACLAAPYLATMNPSARFDSDRGRTLRRHLHFRQALDVRSFTKRKHTFRRFTPALHAFLLPFEHIDSRMERRSVHVPQLPFLP